MTCQGERRKQVRERREDESGKGKVSCFIKKLKIPHLFWVFENFGLKLRFLKHSSLIFFW